MNHTTKKIFRLISVALLATAMGLNAAPTRAWNQGDPSAEEQYAMENLNAARVDPVAFARRFFNLCNADPVVTAYVAGLGRNASVSAQSRIIDLAMTALQGQYENALKNEASGGANTKSPIGREPLAFYPAFQQQAVYWNGRTTVVKPEPDLPLPTYIKKVTSNESINGIAGGTSQVAFSGPNATGGTADFGLAGTGRYSHAYSANLYTPLVTGREWVIGLGASDELLSRGDLLPDFSVGRIRMAGIAVRDGTDGNRVLTYFNAGSEYFIKHDLPYGITGTAFITGVVYQDKNSNGLYDIGEGSAGATIMPDRGEWFAVSSSSGGFAIPVQTNSGSYKLTITTGPLQGATATVSVGVENVKQDWFFAADPKVLPAQVLVGEPSGSTQLVGLSTRGLVETGANALIGGFVITGPANAKKKVLIRGVGPTLRYVFKIQEAILAVILEVYNSSNEKIAYNFQWKTNPDRGAAVAAAAVSIGDFPLGDDYDSAVVLELPPGGYTAVVRPVNEQQPGGKIGMLEIYDITPTVGGKFVAISTRARVDQGIRQMIVGCTISGSGLKRVLIRGVGAELGGFGVPGSLPNPTLKLFDNSQAVIATNDDWSNSEQTNQIRGLANASGAFALTEGSPDASLLRLLAPGNYSAAITAASNTYNTGVALIELYESP